MVPFNAFFFTLLVFGAFVALAQWRQSKDTAILWYVGYLLGTLAHYGQAFWINVSLEENWPPPPDLPLHWNTPTSYAAQACYFVFVDQVMGFRTTAPGASRLLRGLACTLGALIGVNLVLQVVAGYAVADAVHQVVLLLVFPVLVGLSVYLLRQSRPFYRRLIAVGSAVLTLVFLSVIATRLVPPAERTDLIRDAIRCFSTPWGKFYFFHLKVGIVVDVLCFSWALTLRQRELLLAALPLPVPQTIVVVPRDAALEDSFLLKIRDFLSTHFQQDNLSASDLARAVFLSADQATRRLKEKTGLTAEQYLLRYRLERALELLLGTDKSVGEIATAVGLKDPAHFSRVFRKQYGQSPREIRKNPRENPV